MRIPLRFSIACVLLAVLPALGLAQSGGDGETTGVLEVGGWDASTSGSPDPVTEYEPEGGGLDLVLSLDSLQDWGAVELDGRFHDGDDLDWDFAFDVNRSVRSRTTLDRVLHRLGHESLDHLAAVTNHGRVTRHTDLAPGAVYEIDYQLLEHRTEIQPRGLANLTLAVGYRQQDREGTRQATTVSHCDSCHVVSQSRPIDETTSDAALEASWAWRGGRFGASFTSRELETDPMAISLLYDDALHPELRLPLFDNRLQYDSAQGPQPIDQRPDVGKEVLRLDAQVERLGGFAVAGEGVWSTTENETTGLEADYSGFLVTAWRSFAKRWDVRWRGRSYKLESDDVFVDAAEPLGVAGPQAGRTYRQIYGLDPDFLRRSSLVRDVFESELGATLDVGKKAGKARFFWEYEKIDRENYAVAPGETASTTSVLGVSWRARPKKGWMTRLLFQHGETDDPFMLVDGSFSTLTSPAVPNPFDPAGAQYYESHAARIEDTTASPASWDEADVRASYSSGSTSVSGSYRWWEGDNSEGDQTDWSRSHQAASLTLWSAPSPRWEWQAAWVWSDTELETPAAIPLFDG